MSQPHYSAATASRKTVAPTLEAGRLDRRQVLGAFADGAYLLPVYGSDAASVAHQIYSWLSGIEPTDEEVAGFTWNGWHARKVLAYRRGREWLLDAYSGYLPERLPYR